MRSREDPPPDATPDGAALRTLLISDLIESTRLLEELGDGPAAELFRRHDRAARDLLKEHGGLEIDKTDGFLLLFERPWEAVLYALAYHRLLAELSQETEVGLMARVGIHLGEVMLYRNTPEDVARGAKRVEVEGLAKPTAARLMSLAQGRQTLLTGGAFDLAKRRAIGELPNLSWLGHGAYLFKGVQEAVDVFEVGEKGFSPLVAPRGSEKARLKGEGKWGVLPVPNLPPHHLPRTEDLEPLKRGLLATSAGKLGVTGSARTLVGVQGMGGIGKTVLAAAACRDPEVEATFTDGIVWITVGQEPDLLRLQQDFAKALGAGDTVLESVAEGQRVLERELAKCCVLLVLDDVWELRHASALDVVGHASRLLVTTRNREILVGLGAEEIQLDVLSPEQSRALLALWARESPDALPAIAAEVAEACGHLPLALAMVGAMVRLEPTAWPDALERLERADLDKIRQQFPDYPYPDLLRALDVSVQALDRPDRERYVELAVFLEEASVPRAAVAVLWSASGLDGLEARALIRRLVARSLARLDDEGGVSLHDLQADYVRRQAGDVRELHERLLTGYRARMPEDFAQGEPDGYFHEHLAAHLKQAGQLKELRVLLGDYRWLEAKLRVSDLQALLADYEELPASDPLRRVGHALRLAAHVLVRAPEELPTQLMGRLLDETDHEGIAQLLEGARRRGASQGWLRPLRRSLEAPGGTLLQILEGHTEAVHGVAALADGRVVSASYDSTLRVWDPDTGETLQTLEGHTEAVHGVTGLANGRVASASEDKTLRLWDPNTGETLQTLEGHTGWVNGVAGLADGRVVSASDDSTLRVWDPDTGETLLTLGGHTYGVLGVAGLADGRVVSASKDPTLRVWAPDASDALQALGGHTSGVLGVAGLADGRVVSASADSTLRVWDPDTGETLQTLEGHMALVGGVAALADGRVVSASFDFTLRVWDPDTGGILRTLEGHKHWVRSVAELADGRVVSASYDSTLRVWDPDTGETLQTLEGHTEAVHAVAGLADGRVVSASFDSTLRVWDPDTGETLQTLEGHTGWVNGVAGLADGRVVSASFDSTLRVWDPDTGETLQTLEGHTEAVLSVAGLADGRVVSASSDSTLRVWDPDTGKSVAALHTDAEPVCVAAGCDPGTLVAGDAGGRWHLLRFEIAV